MALCLVVEDEPRQRAVLDGTLRAEGYETLGAGTAAEALALASKHHPELILLDLGLPDGDGLEVLPELLATCRLARVIVLTGRDSVRSAVSALRAGARHYLVKPWDRDELLLVVAREARAVDLAEQRERDDHSSIFWGHHDELQRISRELRKVASSPLTPVLIQGETGTGKEVLARELHRQSQCTGLFVALNCAAVPAGLIESELFGHERGAFTGADARKRGVVELARDGTLFLDEIAELPVDLQPRLLRFLQDHSFRRVGGEDELNSRCRVVAATHRDLTAAQSNGRFRTDLYYRLAVVNLRLPPLRDRRDELLPLASLLVRQIAQGLGRPPRPLSPDAEQALLAHGWPGNIRELRNRLERSLVLGEDQQICAQDLDLRPGSTTPPLAGDDDEPARLRKALAAERWNVSRAARRLGVARHWLRYRMQVFGIAKPAAR
ncbi:MAG: sigma-54 dependent transcriptional regulator [Myxococcales bacterium]